MTKPIKAILIAFVAVIVLLGGLVIYVDTMDASKYRHEIVKALSDKTGRAVKLSGPIDFSLGFSGLRVSVQDASLANPEGASRPTMASMGKFELGLGLWPLLQRQIYVQTLSIENADILLETAASGQRNWDFKSAAPKPAGAPAARPKAAELAPEPRFNIDNVKIVNSQIAIRGANQKVNSFNVASMQLERKASGAVLIMTGDINGKPLTFDVKTSLINLFGKEPFSFDVAATFNDTHLNAQGRADVQGGAATLSSYELSAGGTKMSGALTATWSGPRPVIKGSLKSSRVNMADFKAPDATQESDKENKASEKKESPPSAKRLFGDNVLPFDALTALDADLDVEIGEMPMGEAVLSRIAAKLVLSGGNLSIAPLKALLGESAINAEIKVNASQAPARVAMGLLANSVDLKELQKLGSIPAFMLGRGGANIQLTGEGNTPHEIASTLGGIVVLTAEKGEILRGAAADISSSLATLFNPGGGNNALNCMAARFNVKNGVMTDNGILVDSVATTIAGNGTVNLASEMIAIILRAKTKLMDVGGVVPALQVSGDLASPSFSVDAVGTVKNVIGSLAAGNINVTSSAVPDIQPDPAGKNACIYTLDHPQNKPPSSVLVPGAINKEKVKDIGNQVIKGLFGQ